MEQCKKKEKYDKKDFSNNLIISLLISLLDNFIITVVDRSVISTMISLIISGSFESRQNSRISKETSQYLESVVKIYSISANEE